MPDSIIVQLSYLQWLDSEEEQRQRKYAMFRSYYDGEHETQLTARMREFLELSEDQEFNCNFCPIVVDSLAERLVVVGFDCESDEQRQLFWSWWQKSRADAVQKITHLSAVRDGDTYILVDFDEENDRPRFNHENAFDGTQGVHIVYSDERRDEIIVAIKRWNAGKTRRANLYYPDRIEKYVDYGDSGGWQPYYDTLLTDQNGDVVVDDKGDVQYEWPIAWSAADGSPLGVPIVHFKNKDQGYSYGESELEDVVPLQNGLNKSYIDVLASADSTGFQMLWMTGNKPEKAKIGPGRWVYAPNADARIGTLSPADLSRIVALKDSVAADIAKVTRTPISHFQLTGQVAAEGTLKQQESGLLSKIADRQVTYGNAWEDAMSIARRLFNTFGTGAQLDEQITISTLWKDAETRNEKEHLESLKIKKELGVSQVTIWREMGYDDDAIERMKQELLEEQSAQASSLAMALVNQERKFNAGDDESDEAAE